MIPPGLLLTVPGPCVLTVRVARAENIALTVTDPAPATLHGLVPLHQLPSGQAATVYVGKGGNSRTVECSYLVAIGRSGRPGSVSVRCDPGRGLRKLAIRSSRALGSLDDETRLTAGVVEPTQIELRRCDRRPEKNAGGDQSGQQDRASPPEPEARASSADISCWEHNDPPVLRKTTISQRANSPSFGSPAVKPVA